MNFQETFLESAIKRFREYKALGDKTFLQLKGNEFHFAPNEASNSIAVIIQHMHGNMLSRWTNFLTEDGEKPWRDRDGEFEIHALSQEELVIKWEDGWKVVLDTISSLSADDLLKTITIRSQPLTVVDAINRQLAHYSYHVGQIVYLGRWIRSSEWTSLSIPKNASAQFNRKMQEKKPG